MKIRRDARGLYIANPRGSVYRPGDVAGFSHVYAMGDGGLVEGDIPKTTHVSQAPLVKIRLDDGTVLYWADEAVHPKIENTGPEKVTRNRDENAADPRVSDRFYAVLCDSPRNTGKTLARIRPPHAGKGNFWTENDVSLIWKMDRATAEDIVSRLGHNQPRLVRYERAIAIIERQALKPEAKLADDDPQP